MRPRRSHRSKSYALRSGTVDASDDLDVIYLLKRAPWRVDESKAR